MSGNREVDSDELTLEKALQQHVFIETIFQHLPIGIAVNKIDDNTAVFINKHFSEIYGWPENTLTDVATFFENVFPNESYRTEMSTKIMEDIASGDPTRMSWQEVDIVTQSGESRVVNAKNIPLYSQNLMISTVVDVTIQKKQNDRLNEIALINAHEIRRPIASILGLLQLFKDEFVSKPENELLKHLQSVTEELDGVIKRVIDKTM
jgi:PAS domain S-box-containing protein